MAEQNPFLSGPYAPVEQEITAFDLPVTGTLPRELSGCYLRNGPNPMGLEDPGNRWGEAHWFLGAGMVHGVRLRDGRAEWYRNRWVRSRRVAEALGGKWPGGPVHDDTDFAANTHIIRHAGRLLATVEAGPLPYQLTESWRPSGRSTSAGSSRRLRRAHQAGPADRRTARHRLLLGLGLRPTRRGRRGRPGDPDRRTSGVPDGPMMHDFALTDRYGAVRPARHVQHGRGVGRAEVPYTWNPAHRRGSGCCRAPAGSDGIRWFEIEPCWVFHTLNAYDDGDRVVVDLARYAGPYDVSALEGKGPLTLDRWSIDPGSGKVRQQSLDDRAQEFPRVDDRIVSQPHRYGYSAVISVVSRDTVSLNGDFADGAFANALLKHDLTAGTAEAHEFGRDATAGEAVFAPASATAGEDDGYVLAFIHNPERGAADLVLLAAQDFTAEPVARVHLPARIPLGFHGSWLPD